MGTQQTPAKPASFVESLKAVGASFFGVRGRKSHEADFARLNPLHVIVAGLLMALAFILTLVFVVKAITS